MFGRLGADTNPVRSRSSFLEAQVATADSARAAPEVYPGASERPDTVTHTGLRKGMARTGALPAPLARVSTRFGTPVTAVLMQTAVAVAVALAVGLPLGPYNLFNLLGTTGTFVYIPIFILMNVAAFKFFRDKHRDEFRILPLVVAPVVSTVALITIGYKSIVPLPAAPVAFAPALAAGYLLLGVLVLFGRNLRPGRRGWMVHAGELPDIG
jgi:amino acid transporter